MTALTITPADGRAMLVTILIVCLIKGPVWLRSYREGKEMNVRLDANRSLDEYAKNMRDCYARRLIGPEEHDAAYEEIITIRARLRNLMGEAHAAYGYPPTEEPK